MNLGLLMVAPMVELLIFLGFSHSWKIGNTKREVNFKTIEVLKVLNFFTVSMGEGDGLF